MTRACLICHESEHEELILNELPLLRCRQCGLIRREKFDMPISHYEELDVCDTPEKREIRFRNSLDRVKTLFRFVPRVGWCDVGTGEGIFLEALATIGGQGVGIEPSRKGCKKAIAHGVKIVGHDIKDIDVISKIEPVRVVSLFHVIEHLEHPDIEVRRIYDALPPGGFLIIETPDIDSPVFRLRKYKDQLIYPEHLWYFSDNTLRALLKHIGFHIVASGGRDFDQYNISIRESLFRLGLSLKKPGALRSNADARRREGGALLSPRAWNLFRKVVRRILSSVVVATGRLQYVWVVAQK